MVFRFRKMIARRLEQATRAYRFVLPHRLGWLAGLLLKRLLGRVHLAEEQKAALKTLPPNAVVVYLSKHRSRLERLFGPIRLRAEGLPGAAVGFECSTLWVFPMAAALNLVIAKAVHGLRYWRLPNPFIGETLFRAVIQGGAHVPLVAPRVHSGRHLPRGNDPLAYLIALQRSCDRPLFLVPQLFFYSHGPAFARRTLLSALFGLEPRAGRLERLWKLLVTPGAVFVELGAPVSLESRIGRLDDGTRSDEEMARILRREMIEEIDRHRRSVTGPIFPAVEEIRQRVLTGERLLGFMKILARRRNRSLHRIRKEAVGILDDIAALPNPYLLRLGLALADRLVSRLFESPMVDTTHLEAVRLASQRGPVALIPCHKSHMDSLVLSWVMHRSRLPCPYIFAGRNLAFWPMGWLLRRMGAFFVRRSFKGAIFYAAVFSEYIHSMLEQGAGTHIAAFIEGTRSRSGKLLPPQAGMLTVLVNAVKNGACYDLTLAPVFIGYDRVPDEAAYLHELRGGEKRPESVWQMIRAWRLLGRRYGKIYVSFAPPVSLKQDLDDRGHAMDRMTPREMNEFSRDLGARLLRAVNAATRVTPQALVCAVLLNSPSGIIDRERFFELFQSFLNHLGLRGAELTESLRIDPEGAATHVVRELIRSRHVEAVTGFGDANTVPDGIRVPAARRIDLAFYKNNTIALFAQAAFAAAAVLNANAFQFDAPSLHRDYRYLADLMENEFPRPGDEDDGAAMRKALKAFIDDGILFPHPTLPETYRVTSAGFRKLKAFAAFVVPLLESYVVVLRYLGGSPNPRVRGKERLGRIERLGRRLYRHGEIVRRESLSGVTYANALNAFSRLGITGKPSGAPVDSHLGRIRRLIERTLNH